MASCFTVFQNCPLWPLESTFSFSSNISNSHGGGPSYPAHGARAPPLFQGSKVLAKKELAYVPIIGWMWYFTEMVFCTRKWEQDRKTVAKSLLHLRDYPEKYFVRKAHTSPDARPPRQPDMPPAALPACPRPATLCTRGLGPAL